MMDKLSVAREEINRIDREMAKLFCERMEAVKSVAEYKKERGLPILDSTREGRRLFRYVVCAKVRHEVSHLLLRPQATHGYFCVEDVALHLRLVGSLHSWRVGCGNSIDYQ